MNDAGIKKKIKIPTQINVTKKSFTESSDHIGKV